MSYSTLFLDIGGVILTNGWDHHAREKAIDQFQLDAKEFNSRHSLLFDPFEIGKISLDAYIQQVVFYKAQLFTLNDFKEFMFKQSQPFKEMLNLFQEMKKRYGLKIVAVSNEGKELMQYRVDTFQLTDLIDFFVGSASIHLRKPDLEMYQFAIDAVQKPAEEIIYVDDRPLLAEIGAKLGLKSIHHVSYENTCKQLQELLTG